MSRATLEAFLNFSRTNFNLPLLSYADTPADDLSDCFNFAQTPIAFQTIPAALTADYFMNDKRPPTMTKVDERERRVGLSRGPTSPV